MFRTDYQGVRKGLARLALSKNGTLLQTLLASDDPALRAAAYSNGPITPDELSAAYERDGELAFNEAVYNHKIWRSEDGRAALHGIAWAVVRADKHSDLMAANIFNSVQIDLAKKHPDWFKDQEERLPIVADASHEPATRADLLALSDTLAHPGNGHAIEQVRHSLLALNSRLGWVWWFSLGALVTGIWRH